MIVNGKIIVSSDAEHFGSYYYFNTEECLWYGDSKSKLLVVKRNVPRPDYMQKILTKIAIKSGYPKEIFKQKKNTHMGVQTQAKPMKNQTKKTKSVKAKKQNSTFISLF